MIIGIVGLGLIGGSFAKCIKAKTDNKVFAADVDSQTMESARLCGIVDEVLTDKNISRCELIILAVPPSSILEWISSHAHELSHGCTVMDICGVKRVICEAVQPLANQYGFTFVGGHPMAGREHGGFANSTADLFEGASMILTSPAPKNLSYLLNELGFSSVTFTSPEEHDRITAYTSQLPHLISSAFVKSNEDVRGFTGGSFRDMTRVAKMDVKLWTELFVNNRDFLIEKTEAMLENLTKYLNALKNNDALQLEELLKEGCEQCR